MISRRNVLLGVASTLAALPSTALAAKNKRKEFVLDPEFEPQMVSFGGYRPGMIVVDPANHFLYLTMAGGRALRYGVGVGKAGLAFKGSARIGRKAEWPSWTPTANMIRRSPKKYARYANGVPGGPGNPLGCAGLVSVSKQPGYLLSNSRNHRTAIHRAIRFQWLHSHDQ